MLKQSLVALMAVISLTGIAQAEEATTDVVGATTGTVDGAPEIRWFDAKTYPNFLNPATFAQMMNPKFYARFIDPQTYTPAVLPATYSQFLNADVYAAFISPQTWIQFVNPANYAVFLDLNTYKQLITAANYMDFINPTSYAKWVDGAAYSDVVKTYGDLLGKVNVNGLLDSAKAALTSAKDAAVTAVGQQG